MTLRYGWHSILLSLLIFSTPQLSAATPGPQDEAVQQEAIFQEESALQEELVLSPEQRHMLEECDESRMDADLESSSPIDRALNVARSLLGSPYSPGGSSPNGFDCSGLVRYVFSQIGIELPHSSRAQFGQVSQIPREELQPGDLLFFKIARKRISHVGIYIDEDRFIHAPTSGKSVSYSSLTEPYWKKHFAGAGRLQVSYTPEGPES